MPQGIYKEDITMISAGDFRNGLTVLIEGNIYQILEFQHVKPGKGAAFVRTKLKNIISGGVVEKTFRPTEKFDTAHIDRKDMQYLYSDGELYHFMDVETFDQIAVDGDTVGDSLKFVKENEMVKVCSHEGNVFSVEPPISVELEVTETEPGVKGDTATGATKPLSLRQEQVFLYRFSLTRVTRSKLIPVQESTAQEHNPFVIIHKIKTEIKAESRGRSSCFRLFCMSMPFWREKECSCNLKKGQI